MQAPTEKDKKLRLSARVRLKGTQEAGSQPGKDKACCKRHGLYDNLFQKSNK